MGLQHNRLRRRIVAFLVLTTTFYVFTGVLTAWQAYAQFETTPEGSYLSAPITGVPSGSDDENVKAYYRYLDQTDLALKRETYGISASNLLWAYGSMGLTFIIFYFFIFAWYARRTSGDLYPVEVYNGYISERGGPVDQFNVAFYVIIGTYMAYYIFITIVYGQIY